MAHLTYIDLVNSLRDRLNEVHLTTANFDSVVGFDQFCKDAVNYAYHDILNAEMEWPFLHHTGIIKTIPGTQYYNVISNNAYVIKTIDWDSFYMVNNAVSNNIANEVHTIPATAPYIVIPTNIANYISDMGVTYSPSGFALTGVGEDPQIAGQYTFLAGQYYFNSADASVAINLNYQTLTAGIISPVAANHIVYMDYDVWRSVFLNRDFNANNISGLGAPTNVFKTQNYGEIGLTPIPGQIYGIQFEYWTDPVDMINTTDVSELPDRFTQIIIDGAQKYCYEFREDPPLAQMADARFKAGIARMRIELINRACDVQSGMRWGSIGYIGNVGWGW